MDDGNKTIRTEQNTVCFTGHRSVLKEEIASVKANLQKIIERCWMDGFRWFICGGALGFDTLAAEEILSFRNQHPEIGLMIAIPCENQDRHWSGQDRSRYRQICRSADNVIVLSPFYFEGCMHLRNQYMVQHSSLCICFLRQFTGGTGYTVRYALSKHKKVINIYPVTERNNLSVIKESAWNYTFICPSAPANVFIARSIHFPAVLNRQSGIIFMNSPGKHRSERKK